MGGPGFKGSNEGLYASATAIADVVLVPPPQMRAKKVGKPDRFIVATIRGLVLGAVGQEVVRVAETPATGFWAATA